MKEIKVVLMLVCVLLCATACTNKNTGTNMKVLTDGVTMQSIRTDFKKRSVWFDYAADLLLEHYRLFLDREPGSSSGGVYRLADPEWSIIYNGNEWTPEEWEALQYVLNTDGLIHVEYSVYQYPEIKFIFYIPDGDSDFYVYSLRKYLSDESYSLNNTAKQAQSRSISPNSYDIYDILPNPGWYATLKP